RLDRVADHQRRNGVQPLGAGQEFLPERVQVALTQLPHRCASGDQKGAEFRACDGVLLTCGAKMV
ncbi:MAG: hypothetical protein ACJ8H8_10435, partial [Geminicoccaceae bacterium]